MIAALNNDLPPFDQFVKEQLAADLLRRDPAREKGDRSSLAALGFLILGQRFLNSPPDIIADPVSVER